MSAAHSPVRAPWTLDAEGRVYGGRVSHVLKTLKGRIGKAYCGESLWKHHWFAPHASTPRCKGCQAKAFA